MKFLSVRQPWASLIVSGIKPVENRTRMTVYRGPLLIHASLRIERRHFPMPVKLPSSDEDLPRGGIIGAVLLTGCVEHSSSPWFSGPYGWTLSNATELPFIPMKGSLVVQAPPDNIRQRIETLPEWQHLCEIWRTSHLESTASRSIANCRNNS